MEGMGHTLRSPCGLDHMRSPMVRPTGWFDSFVADCLARLPDPTFPEEKDAIVDQAISFWNVVSSGKQRL